MAKKYLLVLVFTVIGMWGAFAQEDGKSEAVTVPQTEQELWGGKKNFVSGDVGLLVFGAKYERLLTPNISIGGIFYWANSFFIFNELEVGVFGRYYIWKGLYGELGLGFHTHQGLGSVTIDGETYSNELVVINGIGITPGLGWKFDPGKPGRFFLEPGIRIPITIGSGQAAYYSGKGSGIGAGFLIYLGLGYAF
jgi:hypothetical protein